MTLLASPATVTTIAGGLDHPECVCLGSDGLLYAGGEAGQVYRFAPAGGAVTRIADTGGFLLGVAADGDGAIHVCDTTHNIVQRVGPDGTVTTRATGFTLPNFALFDAAGNCFVSDSGAYWDATGTGTIRVIRPDGRDEVFHRGPFRFANGLAFDPTGAWLYVVQSTAGNVVRIPLDRADGPIETVCQLPAERVPDGVTCTDDGALLVSCYAPDELWLAAPGAAPRCLVRDPSHELLPSPANTLLHDGRIFVACLGGWSVVALATELRPRHIHHPRHLHPGSLQRGQA